MSVDTACSSPSADAAFDAAPTARIAVLGGGASGEREVSLATARGIRMALGASHSVVAVEVTVEGLWKTESFSLPPERALLELSDVDAFFIALHGGAGEDGTLQGFLELAGRRYTGSGVRASALCMDKLATRGLARSVDVRVAPGMCISARAWRSDRARTLAAASALSADGWVVKPRCGGSSVNTSIFTESSLLPEAIERVLADGDDALVEARIEGVELSCGVLEDPDGAPRALPPIEIQPAKGRFFDYEQKYSSSGAREVCPPTSVDASVQSRVRELAERMHAAAGCRGYSRIDFIAPSEEVGGEPCLLEINTLPGMTERSLLPQEAAVIGIGYDELCRRILASAFAAHGVRR